MTPTRAHCPWHQRLLDAGIVMLATTLLPTTGLASDVAATSPAELPPATSSDTAGEQTLYLDVILNQAARGLAPFILANGRLRADVQTLRGLGFRMGERASTEQVFLDQIDGLKARYDASLQQLTLEAPLALLDLPQTVLEAPQTPHASASASPGILVAYDVYASHSEGGDNLTVTPELRAFGVGGGVFSTTTVLRALRRSEDPGWWTDAVRLDSAWRLDLPDSAISVTAGDFYTGYVDWSRSVHMGGVQIARNYGLQPYRILTPTPTFLGEAALPSSVELYVDGLRQYSGQVPAGPFQLATHPGISGTGAAQVVVTDAFGQVRTLDFSFYGSPQLLAAGLSDWSLELGRVRRNYGIESFAYDSHNVASGTLRRGIDDRLTLELHGEAGGLGLAGIGALWQLPRAGVLSGSYAHSRANGRDGGQYALGYNWNDRIFNLNLGTQRTHGDFRDIGALQGGLPPRISDRAIFGVNVQRLGSISMSYLHLAYREGDASRYAGVFWSRGFGRSWSANLSLNQNLDDAGDRNLYFSLSTLFGQTRQASVSMQRNGSSRALAADLSRPVPGDGDLGGYGWRLQARSGDSSGGLAEIGLLGLHGRYSAGIANQGGDSSSYASATGSLVWMDGHLFAARDISDAFAVVSTDGFAGVPVRLENRLIGVTNASGALLVTPLQPWQRNQLSIDVMQLPATLSVDRVEAQVTPREGTGVVVEFGIRQASAATLILHDADGQPVPVGSIVYLAAAPDRRGVVGYDGEAYLEGLQAHNRIEVESDELRCGADFDYPEDAEAIPRIGPLTCSREASP